MPSKTGSPRFWVRLWTSLKSHPTGRGYSKRSIGTGCLPSKRAGRRFQDILDNIESIERYTRGMNERKFVANDLVADAVERCLSRISEAARKLGKTAETLVPDEPWPKIRGLGNLLRHDYDIVLRARSCGRSSATIFRHCDGLVARHSRTSTRGRVRPAHHRLAAASSLSRESTQRSSPSRVSSFFQNGARVLR